MTLGDILGVERHDQIEALSESDLRLVAPHLTTYSPDDQERILELVTAGYNFVDRDPVQLFDLASLATLEIDYERLTEKLEAGFDVSELLEQNLVRRRSLEEALAIDKESIERFPDNSRRIERLRKITERRFFGEVDQD